MEDTQVLSQQQVNDTLMYFEEFSNALNSVGINAYNVALRNKYFVNPLIKTLTFKKFKFLIKSLE